MVIVANESAAGVEVGNTVRARKTTKISIEIGVGGRGLVRGQPATEGKSGALVRSPVDRRDVLGSQSLGLLAIGTEA
jgi:hypothetical protein